MQLTTEAKDYLAGLLETCGMQAVLDELADLCDTNAAIESRDYPFRSPWYELARGLEGVEVPSSLQDKD